MKLIGSRMESDFLKELTQSSDALQEPGSILRKALAAEGHDTKTAYVLHWIPEQLEDLYTVLITGSYLVDVEIAKYDNSNPQ
ncbi:hypothetical protein GL2_25490 [Microbulbifer sp. GL-2]|nr:hypothetical protein GL2_25490 [Microbulbifer sp. GL-2]